jgi:hypothetical protein
LAEPVVAFTGPGRPFADSRVRAIPLPSTLSLGSQGGSLEAQMAGERQANGKWNARWVAAFWFTGVVLFVMELNAGRDYLQARLSSLPHNSLGFLPALGLAAWKVVEATFWHYGQLEASFRIMPLVTLPFLLLGLALVLKGKASWLRSEGAEK